MMVQIICFSFNRAMQLDSLLTSLLENWISPEIKVDIVYNYSSTVFGDGYNMLIKKFKGNKITFYKENTTVVKYSMWELLRPTNAVRLCRSIKLRNPQTNFRSIVIKLLEESEADNVMFLTDDSMFVNKVNILPYILEWINENPSENQFSLRMGLKIDQKLENVINDGDLCRWNMYDTNSKGWWSYPFSVDAHIYNKSYILKLFRAYVFTNPNTLEANICSSVKRQKKLGQAMCFSEIKMLTFPINMVQTTIDNICQGVSVDMLNERYLKGETMKYGLDDNFDATKQYVRYLLFRTKKGEISRLEINTNPNIRPNSD